MCDLSLDIHMCGILLDFLGQFPLYVLDVHTRVQGGLYLDYLKCDLYGRYWNHFHFHFLLKYLINLNCMSHLSV